MIQKGTNSMIQVGEGPSAWVWLHCHGTLQMTMKWYEAEILGRQLLIAAEEAKRSEHKP